MQWPQTHDRGLLLGGTVGYLQIDHVISSFGMAQSLMLEYMAILKKLVKLVILHGCRYLQLVQIGRCSVLALSRTLLLRFGQAPSLVLPGSEWSQIF